MHGIYGNGIIVDPSKVEAVLNCEIPNNVVQIQIFLELARYYQHFVHDFSKITTPLTQLTRKGIKFFI